jgi:rubrerythrin
MDDKYSASLRTSSDEDLATAGVWTCPICHKNSPMEQFVNMPEVRGLLCPHCLVRFADGMLHCDNCDTWAPFDKTRIADNERRCPRCNEKY